jgi:hypothetical protein
VHGYARSGDEGAVVEILSGLRALDASATAAADVSTARAWAAQFALASGVAASVAEQEIVDLLLRASANRKVREVATSYGIATAIAGN